MIMEFLSKLPKEEDYYLIVNKNNRNEEIINDFFDPIFDGFM